MTREQQWSGPRTHGLQSEVNGAQIPLDSVIGRMILAEQTKGNIKLDHILYELHFLPDRIARSVSAPPKPRGSLKQYTDFLQTVFYLMLLIAAIMLWWREPDLFHKVMLALAVR